MVALSVQHPLSPYCQDWLSKIELGKKAKWERFGQFAEEAMRFFDGAHDWMWKEGYSNGPGGFLDKGATKPTFKMTVNRVFEAVALYGPALYHQNPNVLATPVPKPPFSPEAVGIDPSDPMGVMVYEQLQQMEAIDFSKKRTQAEYFSHYANWLLVEGNQKYQSRRSITEAVVKGMGLLWVEMQSAPGSSVTYPAAIYDSVDNLVVDPDATCWEDVQWIARRCVHPVNLVEEKYGLPPGSLQGSMQSGNMQATTAGRRAMTSKKKIGESFDLLEYWQVYSKNGFGGRLKTTDKTSKTAPDMEWVGDYCYIVVAKDVPHPLNLPSELFLKAEDDEEIVAAVEWPIPFWRDPKCGGGWPMTRLYFYDKPGSVWPISIIKPAIGELRFVNWCLSFLADRVAQSCTTYLAMLKSAGVKIQDQITKAVEGRGQLPFTIIELESILAANGNPKITDVISFLQAPDFNESIWRMVSEVLQLIDRRTGITELLAGLRGDSAMRSAEEAKVMDAHTSIRPDDMSMRTEDWLSETSAKQLYAADYLLEGADVAPVLGRIGAHVWDTRRNTEDPESISRDFNFRIEAGSSRRPNMANKQRALNEFGQFAAPILGNMAMGGMVEPWNGYVHDWCKANGLDPQPYLVQPPDPSAPSPEQQAAQAEIEAKQMELQMKAKEMGLRLTFEKQDHKQSMKQDSEKHKLEMAQLRQKGKVETQVGRQRLALQKEQAKVKKSANGKK